MNAKVWSKTSCVYCKMALEELNKRGFSSKVLYIGQNGITKEDLLKEVPNARTVPQIFIEDVYIGGYTELMKYFTSEQECSRYNTFICIIISCLLFPFE